MRIAVIGTGISGLAAAHVLSRAHEVELFERNDYPGGHTNTVVVHRNGRRLALDTGFIVHNDVNYPGLLRLFRDLGVQTQDSEMSFSVSCTRCRLEYSGQRPLAQPLNAARPGVVRLVSDIVHFLRSSRTAIEDPRYERATLASFVEAEGYSRQFRDHYLVPLTASIWSTGTGLALDFPAAYALRFFDNHGMLGFRRHRWRTVVGGSRQYVQRIIDPLGARLRLGAEAVGLTRLAEGIELRTADGETHRFDKAVVATHADEALALLADPSDEERRILGAFPYTRNETVLHTDERLLPRSRSARASWNFSIADCRAGAAAPAITYYLNRLQRLDEPEHYCVTLNRSGQIREDHVIERIVYHHPRYTLAGLDAQRELPRLSGPRHTVFCGAYHGFGFHEDGLASGLAAAERLGARW